MIACAVRSASLPILNTAVLPVRSTPVASAKTFGRPSNTNPTTPSGARHADTDQSAVLDRRHVAAAAGSAMQPSCASRPPCRHASPGSARSRVVDRPFDNAASTSLRLASSTSANTASSSTVSAKRSKNSVIWSSVQLCERGESIRSARHRRRHQRVLGAGMCNRSPVSCTITNRSPGLNARARSADTTVTRSPP